MAPTKTVSPLAAFPLAPSVAVPRVIGCSFGDIGTGKTRFWLTGPAPVVVLSFDRGTEGVVENFRSEHDKEIRVKHYDWEAQDDQDDVSVTKESAILLRNEVIKDIRTAYEFARTVVIDTESMMWNLFRYAEFGSPKGNVPRDFDKVNQLMQKYVAMPKKLTINAGFIQSVKDEWGSATKKTGGVKRWGFSETPKVAQIDLFHYREKGVFKIDVNKARCREAQNLQDKTFNDITLPMLGMMMFPDTEESDWE